MAVNWDVYQGGENDSNFYQILFNCMKFGSVEDVSTESASLVFNGQTVVFEGDLILNGNEVQAGMIHDIKIYDGEVLVAEASGYWLDTGVIGDKIDDLQAGGGSLFDMLTMQPITFDGSEQRDYFIDSDFAGNFMGRGGNDTFLGAGGDDVLNGGSGRDILAGEEGNDTLIGAKGKDTLHGGQGEDTIGGGKHDDVIIGGTQNDLLAGGADSDSFYFINDLGNGANQAGVDTITDFKPGEDIIGLAQTVFSSIGIKLGSGEFHVGGNAQDANDYIIYKAGSGAMFYDADGDGAGAKVKFAILDNKPELSYTDFEMLA